MYELNDKGKLVNVLLNLKARRGGGRGWKTGGQGGRTVHAEESEDVQRDEEQLARINMR
jgi:hypothetical protein